MKVTCILSSYNRPNLIRQALKSVADQTHKDYDLIVSDDGSDFDVERTVRKFDIPNVRILKHSVTPDMRAMTNRLGICMNQALQFAAGDLICFLADDDYYFLDWFERAVNYFEKHDKAKVAFGAIGYSGSMEMEYDKIEQVLAYQNPVHPLDNIDHNMVMHRRFDPPFPWPEDVESMGNPDSRYFTEIWNAGHVFSPIETFAAIKRMHPWNLQYAVEEIRGGRSATVREQPIYSFASDIVSAVTEVECQKLAELAAGKLVLEVGSSFGRSTVALASVASKVHAVDWHKGDSHAWEKETLTSFLSNLERYGVREKVVVHVGDNKDVGPVLAKGTFDFVFLDSYHTFEAVSSDILMFRPLVRPGGVIAFHDYGQDPVGINPPFGVTRAVDEFVARVGLELKVVDHLAYIRLP